MKVRRIWIYGFLLFCVGSWAQGDVVTDWNDISLAAIRTDKTNPPKATRHLAMVHTAIYDAVNSIDRSHRPYHILQSVPAGTSMEAAAAAAAHHILTNVYPAQQAVFDASYVQSLAIIPDDQGKTDGITLGETVANLIIQLRANDHSTDVVSYTPGTDPGDWQPTPPAFAPALLPNWPLVTCWALQSGNQLQPPSKPALDSAEYTAAFNEVKALGAKTGSIRTAEQSEIAQFWSDGAGTETPPGHWNRIAHTLADQQGLTLAQNARLFALLNIALADASIVAWDCKYKFNDWRPITAIREADTDGNPNTDLDPAWESFITTPPFPSYTSGHSTFSGAASTVLARYFGTDNLAFVTISDGLPGVERSFMSLSQAANEAGISRIYGGIHWQYDNQFGLSSGRALGEYVANNVLQAEINADLNNDGVVNYLDLMIFMQQWHNETSFEN